MSRTDDIINDLQKPTWTGKSEKQIKSEILEKLEGVATDRHNYYDPEKKDHFEGKCVMLSDIREILK